MGFAQEPFGITPFGGTMIELPLHEITHDATTITLGWEPVGDLGYRFSRSAGGGKFSHTWDSSRSSARFSKDSDWYKVEAIAIGATGIWPQKTQLPARLPASTGKVITSGVSSGAAEDAIRLAKPGDIVELPSGNYGYINVLGLHPTETITIRPCTGALVKVKRVDFQDSSRFRFTSGSGHVFVTDPDEEYDLNVRFMRCSFIEFSFCEIGFCSQPIYAGDSTKNIGSSDIHVLGNYIHDAGKDANKEHGMYLGYGDNPRWVVASNIVDGTRARGIQFYEGNWSDGFVVNNTVLRAGLGSNGQPNPGETYGYGIQTRVDSWKNMIVANNISVHNQRLGFSSDGAAPSGGRFVNNQAFGNGNSENNFNWDGPQENSIETDPKLDANYVPQSSNPGIPELTPPYTALGGIRSAANIGAK